MSSGGGTTTTVQNNDPWKGAQPYLRDIMANAGGLYGATAPSMGMSPITQGALGLTAQRALDGSPLLQTAQNTVQNFAAGGNTNPYLDQMAQKAASTTRDYAMAPFTAAGRTGSAANAQYVTDSIGNVMNQMYGQQYNADQNRTLAAAQMSPAMANADYMDLQQLLGVGQQYDQSPWSLLGSYANPAGAFGGMGSSASGSSTAPGQSMAPQLAAAGLMATADIWGPALMALI
jgi:hypothetical protein